MTTQNKAVTCYLPKDIEDFITGYCIEYGITRKDKEGVIYPSLGTGIIELLKLLVYNPELVSSPILDTVPSKFSEDAIEKKIDEILEKKLSHLPTNVPSQVTDLDLLTRIENMERLLRLQQSASIASPIPTVEEPSPIPTGEPSPFPPSPPARPAIETVTPEVSPSPPLPGTDAIEDSEKKIIPLPDTLPVPTGETSHLPPSLPPDEQGTDAIETVTSESDSSIELDKGAIETVRGETVTKKGLTDSELARHLGIDKSNITRWKQKGEPTQKYRDKWELRGRFWHEKD
jgi:hypothetical protein